MVPLVVGETRSVYHVARLLRGFFGWLVSVGSFSSVGGRAGITRRRGPAGGCLADAKQPRAEGGAARGCPVGWLGGRIGAQSGPAPALDAGAHDWCQAYGVGGTAPVHSDRAASNPMGPRRPCAFR